MIIAKPGDLAGLFATKQHTFRVGIFLDESRIAVIYERGLGADNQLLDMLAKTCKDSKSLSSIETKNEIAFEDFLEMDYELYDLNVFSKAKEFNRPPCDYLDIVKHNLNQIDTLKAGDIVKFEGYKIFGSYVLYHHHAIFADEERCKVIHKSGEPDLKSLMVAISIVSEDGLLEKASFRKIYKETTFEGTYPAKPPSEVVACARKRLGETEYNVVTGNCQHFCTECRYDKSRSIEVEKTAVAGALVAGAGLLIGSLVYKYFTSSTSKTKEKKEKPIASYS